MTFKTLLDDTAARLAPSVGGPGEARAMVYVMIEHLKHYKPVDCILHADDAVTPWLSQSFEDISARVIAGEPLQYVLGTARFMGNDFIVTPATLIPRPETAMLVDMVTDRFADRTDLRVLDIGTGSGCIAISLARALRFPQVTAIDISEEALDVARRNAEALHARVSLRIDDILTSSPRPDTFDIIISNPPYIARSEAASIDPRVKDHEPQSALFVPDSDPLLFYRAIASYAAVALAPDGMLFLEINPLFADRLRDTLAAAGLTDITLSRDFNDTIRFATALAPRR